MAGKVQLKTAKDGSGYFSLLAGNGENILKSEMYKSKSSAQNGIASVQKNAADDARYERKPTTKGQFMFNLKAANHQVIGTSESYTTESARDKGIESVKKNAPNAKIEDLTA